MRSPEHARTYETTKFPAVTRARLTCCSERTPRRAFAALAAFGGGCRRDYAVEGRARAVCRAQCNARRSGTHTRGRAFNGIHAGRAFVVAEQFRPDAATGEGEPVA